MDNNNSNKNKSNDKRKAEVKVRKLVKGQKQGQAPRPCLPMYF